MYIVHRPIRDYFTDIGMSLGRDLLPLSGDESLKISCHTSYDTGPQFTQSYPKDRPFNYLFQHARGIENIF